MKKLLGISLVVFVGTLAVVIGQRMSTDAMAVVIGVIFGVAASIPTSLLIIAATRRTANERPATRSSPPDRYVPPVIVVSPGGQESTWRPPGGTTPPLPSPSQRRFRIVGEDGSYRSWDDDSIEAEGWRTD